MEFATGAMGTLLPKLGALLAEEYRLKKTVKEGIKYLRDELLSMQAALEKVSNVPLDQLDPLVKIWANDIRELSYAIEDSLDSAMVCVEGLEPTKPHSFMGFVNKARNKITKFKIRHEIADDIKDIKIQVTEVKERYDRYKVNDVVANISATTIDPRLSALYSKVSDLVGIDMAIDELTKRVSQDHDVSGTMLNTVSVVGFGGLGKTTLTKVVYDKLAKKFDCGGFIPVGQNPDMPKVLKDILHELDKGKYMNIHTSKMDVRQLTDQVRELLSDKRYLIVIDDIWEISTWEKVKCALVDGNPGSRIIITTRICEVANKVGGVYNMKPLSDGNSRKLFYMRIYGGEGNCPDNESAEVPEKILKKCGGVPLSIVTIASLLVGKPREEWCKVYDSIGFGLEDNDVVQNTRKILSFSYYNLPSCLKACLLYLSIFPEDSLIDESELIWRWVAEGFVSDKQGIGLFELGKRCLNELMNRNMIRLIHYSYREDREGYRVHDMLLDLIRTLSTELNFVTIQDTEQHSTCSSSRNNNVRRLAIQKRSMQHNTSMEMEHMRSFNAFMCSGDRMPPLRSFKALRVLVLDNCDFSAGGCHLEHLGKLVQLRYLGLKNTHVAELPREIEHLKLLQTLFVVGTDIEELPPSVSELRKLLCLFIYNGPRMVSGVGKLTSLEELRLTSVETSQSFVMDLGKLTEVRVLQIHFDEMDESVQQNLVESLQNLRKICYVGIELDSETESPRLHIWEVWAPPSTLRNLQLGRIILPRLPSWINPSCVPRLSAINLNVEVLEARDMQILGRLPLLRLLFLRALKDNGISYTVASDEFKNLGLLYTNFEIICGEGGLPMLYSLHCCARVRKDVNLVGNMPLLQEVTYWLNCKDCSAKEVEKREAALRQAARTHPNHPTLRTKRFNFEEVSKTEQETESRDDEDEGSEVASAVDEKEEPDNNDNDNGPEEVATTDEEPDNGGADKIHHATRDDVE